MGSIPPRRSDEHRRSQSEWTHGRDQRIDRRIVVRRFNTAALSARGGSVPPMLPWHACYVCRSDRRLPMGPILLCDSSPGEPAHCLKGVAPHLRPVQARMRLVCRKNGLINQTVCLEECSRRGTSLENVLGDGAYPERLRIG